MADPNEKIHLSTDEARAGTTSNVTRYVLGVSLALVIIIFAIMVLR